MAEEDRFTPESSESVGSSGGEGSKNAGRAEGARASEGAGGAGQGASEVPEQVAPEPAAPQPGGVGAPGPPQTPMGAAAPAEAFPPPGHEGPRRSSEAMGRQATLASALTALAGLWLLISPALVPMTVNMGWSTTPCGIVISVLACARAFGPYRNPWLSWINAAIGLWVIVSPWVLGASTPGLANVVITGILIVVFAAWSGLSHEEGDAAAAAKPRTK